MEVTMETISTTKQKSRWTGASATTSRIIIIIFSFSSRGSGVGVVRATGDSYFLSADVSGFEPHEVVLLVYNQCVVIHAEKMAADGSVAGRFTHKSVLPADMDPLSVSSSLTAERLIISHEKLITF
uniref:SHSP domain-containing protein n=1 Tax=Cyprinus carpio carpio TaxID=630221 RepID=A0A9J8DMG2_CYPCA